MFDYYLFTKNLQGDIIGIYDTNGNCVASYKYNAWGECTVTNNTTSNIGNINPFRYRGYYYDTETGFYYLNARYYDPQIKRFINADEIGYLGANGDLNSYNLYAYCSNNPVMYVDYTGNSLAAVANAFLTFLGCAASDGPSIVGDLVGILFMASAVIDAIWNDSTDTIEKEESLSISAEIDKSFPKKTYYHVTDSFGVGMILKTGLLMGSLEEGGYVFVFNLKPDKYAINNCGAHGRCVVAFETNCAFEIDKGIKDPKISRFIPLISVFKGPIVVENVRVVKYG